MDLWRYRVACDFVFVSGFNRSTHVGGPSIGKKWGTNPYDPVVEVF